MKILLLYVVAMCLVCLPIRLFAQNDMQSFTKQPAGIILAGKESGGRLGDNILLYCKAKYFSFKYHMPLEYKGFPFFEQFVLSQHEKKYEKITDCRFPVRLLVQDKNAFAVNTEQAALYEIDYYCHMRKDKKNIGAYVNCGEYPFDWIKKKMVKYPEFGAELRRNLQVIGHDGAEKIGMKDCVTVAVTTRMGSGNDDRFLYSEQFFDEKSLHFVSRNFYGSHADRVNPFKFVPQQFYINQVKRLSELLHHCTMHVHFFIDKDKIFTEDILRKWRIALSDYKNISIESDMESDCGKRVIDDLVRINECDYLIRGCSHFSGIAQLAGSHKIIIGPDPVSAFWIDATHLIFRKTFIYFQDLQENKFEQYVYEETEKAALQDLADKYGVKNCIGDVTHV